MIDSVLPLSDRRSPFHVNVPPHDAKPVSHLVAYFKLWKHLISALIAYLQDLVLAKEFELNLNLQLVGSVQFPGFRDLAYKTLSNVEQGTSSPTTSQTPTPKTELKTFGTPLTPLMSSDKRPGLSKTKSLSLFLKNQTFAHRRAASTTSVKSEASVSSLGTNGKPSGPHGNQANGKPFGAEPNGPTICAAKYAPKNDVELDPTYFPENSLFTNLPQALVTHHFLTYQAQTKLCRDITCKHIPRLQNLHKNLSIKIKEIRSLLKNDSFANPALIKEVSKTGAVLNTFVSSVRRYSGPKPVSKQDSDEDDDAASLSDPFLIKLRLDYQLKNQLIHENYVFALYVNLQNISKDLLNYVLKDLNGIADRLAKNLSGEAVYASLLESGVYNLAFNLKKHLNALSNDWEYFAANNPHFLNVYQATATSPRREIRGFKDVVVPFASSMHSKCLRCGVMYKKQKLLKSYTSHFYLLTCNYLHEFKLENPASSDKLSEGSPPKKKTKGKIGGVVGHEDTPIKSYSLNDHVLQVKNEQDYKFVLTRVSNPSQKITFKCQSESDFINWTTDLHDLLKFGSNHLKRFKYVEDKLDAREQSEKSKSATPTPETTPNEAKSRIDMNLNLNNLLSHKVSLNKIQSGPSLSGIFTPGIQSPQESNKNPFETNFLEIQPVTPAETGSAGNNSPLSEKSNSRPPTPGRELQDHRNEHEQYLKLQAEILKQQQQLMDLKVSQVPLRLSLSRQTSAELMVSVLEQNNSDLALFLNRNKDLMDDRPEQADFITVDLTAQVPKVFVLTHES